jgi:SWI/SNF-related matrix-associated actin-dependent regulator of chromatin subfamily A containing DEAD/H box 1
MGINLTSADVCIMHDIDMNPFSDHQAEARCHRIGQSKPVNIIKLISQDTVDSAIYEMQERKVKMNAAIMESPSEWSKEEKKEKALILQTVVDRHAKAGAALVNTGKENVQNTIIEISDENEECQL